VLSSASQRHVPRRILRAMKKPLLISLALLLVLVLGAAYLYRTSGTPDPLYEGRPLSLWLEGHTASSAAMPPYKSPGWNKADDILRHSDTNAIPLLLKMIQANDPPRPVLKAMAWIRNHRILPLRAYRYAFTRNEEALYAFEVLGTNAAPAVPALIKIYQQTPYRVGASGSPNTKRCAASALGYIGPPARPALPILLADFTHTNADVRFYAVSAALHIGGDPNVIIPAMCSMLEDSKRETRWNAIVALSMFGGRARSAVPALLQALENPFNLAFAGLKEQLETALWRIAPEKVGKPLVIEDSTPMIAGGLTAQAVDVEFNGKRHTLVPRGQAIPCVRQFWDSEPRGPLTLYRHASDQDHCLGQFETLGLDLPPTNVNVSLLCVIADQQIILCARDNNSNEFLEIRRVK
jgi:hypothetical protein